MTVMMGYKDTHTTGARGRGGGEEGGGGKKTTYMTI